MDHIFALYCVIQFYVTRKRRLYCCFVDLEKAFDTVSRVHLWQKLISTGIDGKMLKVVNSLYENAKSYVSYDRDCSNIFNCSIGVRQGDCLSPLLFAIYLNDLYKHMSDHAIGLQDLFTKSTESLTRNGTLTFLKLFILLYADDTVLMAETGCDLQESLNAYDNYCQRWRLKVNYQKTKIVIFSKGKIRVYPNFYMGTVAIDVVHEFIYLGVLFNYNGSFKKAIARQTQRASAAMFAIIRKMRELDLDIKTVLHLFDACVLPIALYGCEVWGFESVQIVEQLQLKFCKLIMSLKKSTCNVMVYGETGRFPVTCMIQQRMVCFWFRLCSAQRLTKLSHFLYKLLYLSYVDENIKNAWLEKIRLTLCLNGLNFVWLAQGHEEGIDLPWLKYKIKNSLHDSFQQQWHADVDNMTKCENYRLMKEVFEYENYLSFLPDDLRVHLTRFKCRNSKVAVERYHMQTKDNPICHLCNLNIVGDEFHYLLVCPAFEMERKKFVPKYFYTYPVKEKLLVLFKLGQPHLLKIAKFCKAIVKKL